MLMHALFVRMLQYDVLIISTADCKFRFCTSSVSFAMLVMHETVDVRINRSACIYTLSLSAYRTHSRLFCAQRCEIAFRFNHQLSAQTTVVCSLSAYFTHNFT